MLVLISAIEVGLSSFNLLRELVFNWCHDAKPLVFFPLDIL